MGRWTVFLYLLIFYGHTTSQPVTDDTENVRPPRQLDFSECCPCPGAGEDASRDLKAQGSSLVHARNQDDCPCRDRHRNDERNDSEGASSIFFPTSMRSDGPVMRPAEKKEENKPLLHPEVDLASSVLQTLREATDEEYREALARDAARNMAKAAGETSFGDSTPEASTGNIVTIIVNPKQTDSLEDVTPQESRVQESRCIHEPLENVKTDFGKMRVASKPPSLLREIFRLPRINKPASLLHSNLLDMDSSSGASNIQEQVVHVDESRVSNSGIRGLRTYAPLLRSNTLNNVPNMKNNVGKDFSPLKMPDVKWSMKDKLKDLLSTRSSLGDISKINLSPLIPNLKFNNSLSKARGKDIEDLTNSPSNFQEQVKKHRFFSTKSHLENIFEKHRPVGLKNLLKLKDVELIPLKDIIHKTTERPTYSSPKFIWQTDFNKENSLTSKNKNKELSKEAKPTEVKETLPITNTVSTLDHEVSPSNVVEEIHEDECSNGAVKSTEEDIEDSAEKKRLSEIIDTVPSPSDIQTTFDNDPTDLNNNQLDEFIDNSVDCNNEPLRKTETEPPQFNQSSLDTETQEDNPGELDSENSNNLIHDTVEEQQNRESNDVLNEEDCANNNDDDDSMTDSSKNINHILQPKEAAPENVENLPDKNIDMEESCSKEHEERSNMNILDNKPETKLINTLSLEKSMSTIRENIAKKIDNIKNRKTISQNLNIFDENPKIQNIQNSDTDFQNEEIIEITSVKPEPKSDDLKNANKPSDNISMQDLQKISDYMLQQEAQDRKTVDCPNEITESKVPVGVNSKESESDIFEESANTQNELVMDPNNSVDISEESVKNACQSSSNLPKQSFSKQTDPNFGASDTIFSKITPSNNIIESPFLKNKIVEPEEDILSLHESRLPALQDVLIPPTLNDVKLTLTNLFDKNARNAEVFSNLEAEAMSDTTNILNPIMATDASTSNLRSSLPPLRLEDVDLDIFRLKPQSGLLAEFPEIDLHSFKTKLSLPKSLRMKPIKLQSALEDNGSMLGATLTVGRNNVQSSDRNRKITKAVGNPRERMTNLDDLTARMKANAEKIVKMPFALNNHRVPAISEGIGDISDKWKNIQHTFESRLSKSLKKPANIETHDLLGAISRNHEDVNDKVKALHMDFKDRIETLRNNLFDKSRFGTSEFRNRKTNIKSLSSFNNQERDKGLSFQNKQPKRVTDRKESKKSLKPTGIGSQRLSNKKTFKMPAAASVPVPRTVEIPELKTTMTKSPGLLIQRSSSVSTPDFRNIETPTIKESTATLWKHQSKKLYDVNSPLGKHKVYNPYKDSQIKVTFSTTPRPIIATGLQSRKTATPYQSNSERTLGRLGRFQQMEDHNGSPSEMIRSVTSPVTFSQQSQQNLLNSPINSESNNKGRLYEEPSTAELHRTEQKEVGNESRKSNKLQSWPKVSESAFLSKVKEAVKARLSKVKSPVALKQSNEQSGVGRSSFIENEEVLNTDMTRSASENKEIIEGRALKENVSYKCTMLCTKE